MAVREEDRSTLPERGIVLAATPLGNPLDASPRLKEALASAPLVAAEDTRRARALAEALGVTIAGKVVSHFDHNEASRAPELLQAARLGPVLVVTDAGMPVVSDPGLGLVDAAHEAGLPVTCLPGPSAVTTAIALSGLQVGGFIFDGFAPRKPGPKRRWLEGLKEERRAACFFESPHRIEETLRLAEEVLGGERRVAVCRELTKTHEEVWRGPLSRAAAWAAGARGEITVVVDGARPGPPSVELLAERARELAEREGLRLKDACKRVAEGTGVANRDVYNAAQ